MVICIAPCHCLRLLHTRDERRQLLENNKLIAPPVAFNTGCNTLGPERRVTFLTVHISSAKLPIELNINLWHFFQFYSWQLGYIKFSGTFQLEFTLCYCRRPTVQAHKLHHCAGIQYAPYRKQGPVKKAQIFSLHFRFTAEWSGPRFPPTCCCHTVGFKEVQEVGAPWTEL